MTKREPIKSAYTDKDDQGFVVAVETEQGEVFVHPKNFDYLGDAESFAKTVTIAGDINLDCWDYVRTIYGSAAYINNGLELEALKSEKMA